MVLCYLEGMSLEAAAGQLGCPIGTVGVRLMRARERLKIRLSRRGMAVPAGLLVTGAAARSASAALPAALVGSTVNAVMHQATSGIVSLAAAKLTTDVLRNMVMIKMAQDVHGHHGGTGATLASWEDSSFSPECSMRASRKTSGPTRGTNFLDRCESRDEVRRVDRE